MRRVSCAVLVVLLQELVPITNVPDYITTLRTRFRSSLQPHAYRHVLEDFRQSSTERSTATRKLDRHLPFTTADCFVIRINLHLIDLMS